MAWEPRVRRVGRGWEWEATNDMMSVGGDAFTRAGAIRAARRRAASLNRQEGAGPWEAVR